MANPWSDRACQSAVYPTQTSRDNSHNKPHQLLGRLWQSDAASTVYTRPSPRLLQDRLPFTGVARQRLHRSRSDREKRHRATGVVSTGVPCNVRSARAAVI